MRPVTRGTSPWPADFDDYRKAFPFLQSRLGPYCSYCERRMPTLLAVEHIQPKGRPEYAHLIGRWDNYLLGCVNCNSAKRDRDIRLEGVLVPDRDDTSVAFEYRDDGSVVPSPNLSPAVTPLAEALLSLCGLDRAPANLTDENDQLKGQAPAEPDQELLNELRAEHREILLLRYQTGLGVDEIATLIGKNYKSTESLLSRARQELRKVMGKSDDDDDEPVP